ncbi:MAG: S-layer homology domain-containing protein [Clostridia bacterium]|nr:S-layer homology domain-containing protein [Clostridia bacterium]
MRFERIIRFAFTLLVFIMLTAQMSAYAEKYEIGIHADRYEITEDEGAAVLTPYIKTENGTEKSDFEDVRWAVDSVNAFPEVQDDKSLKLTGKIDGEIKVTAYLTYDGETYEPECTIKISGQSERYASRTIKLTTYGNSILRHAPNENLGWQGNWGMAATAADKDYVHRLIYYLEEKYGKGSVIWYIGQSTGGFEYGTSGYEEDEDLSYSFYGLFRESERVKPDVVTVQFGENSNCTNEKVYENALTQFVNNIKDGSPGVIVLVTTPFWGGSAKISGTKNTAKKLDIPVADLAPLFTPENQALDHPEWSSGVQTHPGDLGMERIASEMFKQLNKYLTADEKTVYSSFCDMGRYAWANDAVERLYEKGVISGKGNAVFDPSAPVTREEFVKMLVNAAKIEGESGLKPDFEDVNADEWYFPYVSVMFSRKIVTGISENLFGIGENILRQDMAVMIYRALKDNNPASVTEEESAFADFDNISDYAKEAVSFLESAGLISGAEDGKFNPDSFLSRAEAAVVINRLIDYIG